MATKPMMRCKCVNDQCRRRGQWNLVTIERVGNVLYMPPNFTCVCCLQHMHVDSKLLEAYAREQAKAAKIEADVMG